MEKHINLLGVLYIGFSLLGILFAIFLFLAITGGGLLSGDSQTIAVTSTVGSIITVFLLLISLPGILGGIGLLKRLSWARFLVLILGVLQLVNVPFGTILGAYTLWVLMQNETAQLFVS